MIDPVDLLLPKLEGVRRSGPGAWTARCPAHRDNSPSLSVREASDGRVLIYCFAGCGACDVVAALGLDLADLFPQRSPTTYEPSRQRDPSLPRVSAADALRALDEEALVVGLTAEAIAGGAAPGPLLERLRAAVGRIAEVRLRWELQP